MSSAESGGHLEHLVFEIAKGVWGDTGEAFFHSLVRQLSRVLEGDRVLVGALKACGTRVVTLAAERAGRAAPGFEYDLDGTPARAWSSDAHALIKGASSAFSKGSRAGGDGRRRIRRRAFAGLR